MARVDVDAEGLFGLVHAVGPDRVENPDAIAVGATVKVLAGRARGSTAIVVQLDEVPTPAGFLAYVALIRRPRAGESWELTTNLHPITAAEAAG